MKFATIWHGTELTFLIEHDEMKPMLGLKYKVKQPLFHMKEVFLWAHENEEKDKVVC